MEKKYAPGHKKILILYAPLGVGHKAAANAIAESFATKYPEIEVKNIDTLDFVFDIFKNGLPWMYNQTIMKIPTLYKWIYSYYNYKLTSRHLNSVSVVMLKKSRFVKFIEEFSPDFIISTNPLSMQLVSLTKKRNIINIPSANVCTDYGFHTFWINEDVNYYFVANEDIKNSLIERGTDGNIVKITGIPISEKFIEVLDRKKIINDLNFDDSKPILLIVGGRLNYRSLLKIVSGVKRKNKDLQLIIVAGRDEVLQRKLRGSDIRKNPSIRIFYFVNNLEDYMTVADLILTKAGGLTVSECLAKNLPMVFSDVIPGQEEDNAKYITKRGAGIKANGVKKSIEVINDLFLKPEKLTEMKQCCKNISKPKAAEELVDFIVSKM
jgi:processive 1,2-diacylglycerol beta-glucosyltransferase